MSNILPFRSRAPRPRRFWGTRWTFVLWPTVGWQEVEIWS